MHGERTREVASSNSKVIDPTEVKVTRALFNNTPHARDGTQEGAGREFLHQSHGAATQLDP